MPWKSEPAGREADGAALEPSWARRKTRRKRTGPTELKLIALEDALAVMGAGRKGSRREHRWHPAHSTRPRPTESPPTREATPTDSQVAQVDPGERSRTQWQLPKGYGAVAIVAKRDGGSRLLGSLNFLFCFPGGSPQNWEIMTSLQDPQIFNLYIEGCGNPEGTQNHIPL